MVVERVRWKGGSSDLIQRDIAGLLIELGQGAQAATSPLPFWRWGWEGDEKRVKRTKEWNLNPFVLYPMDWGFKLVIYTVASLTDALAGPSVVLGPSKPKSILQVGEWRWSTGNYPPIVFYYCAMSLIGLGAIHSNPKEGRVARTRTSLSPA